MTTSTQTTQHTPGPWVTGTLGHNVQGANGRLVAATMFVQFGNNSEDVANARLIATAPALLAALEAMMSATFLVPPSQEIINARDIARAAIRAARGEE